jgi:hypothetical protein
MTLQKGKIRLCPLRGGSLLIPQNASRAKVVRGIVWETVLREQEHENGYGADIASSLSQTKVFETAD